MTYVYDGLLEGMSEDDLYDYFKNKAEEEKEKEEKHELR